MRSYRQRAVIATGRAEFRSYRTLEVSDDIDNNSTI
jgi:hypothetical protein